jgi:hypothetical protein
MIKKILFSFLLLCMIFFVMGNAHAGWVSGYTRSDGTYVNGYYRTEPNYYKWDNYSWDNNWNDAYNDRSWYHDYGYDPEPWDDEYVRSYHDYGYNNYYNSYDSCDYDYGYNSYWDY